MQLQTIEDYRQCFRDAPFGVWSTSRTAPADQTLRFFSNRQGMCEIARRLGGGTIHFEWLPFEDCCLRIRRIDPRTRLPKDPDDWLYLRYEFDSVTWNDSDAVVMRLLEFGRLKEFAEPLYFHGNAGSAPQDVHEEEPGARTESLNEQLHGRFLIALFLTGMIVGLGMFVAGQAQVDVDPLIYVFAGIGLFAYLYYLLSRPPRPKPPPEEEYIREQE